MRILLGLTLVALLGVIGCGRDSAKSRVTGEVTLDGETVDEGSISFVPSDGQAPTAGGLIEDGKYSVTMAPGPKKVSINSPETIGQRAAYEQDPNSPMIDIVRDRIPARYNLQTELQFDAPAGSAEKNFELKSK